MHETPWHVRARGSGNDDDVATLLREREREREKIKFTRDEFQPSASSRRRLFHLEFRVFSLDCNVDACDEDERL